jgi:hypothetical protein
MINKMHVKPLLVGIVGLLVGGVIGYSLRPISPSPDLSRPKLTIYDSNADASTIEPQFEVNLSFDLDQRQQLDKVATLVSRYNFCGLPIDVVGLEDNVATINLVEYEWNQSLDAPQPLPGCSGRTWRSSYFQGSTGGMMTSKTLAYTLLQPDVQGAWIDGVQFQYQGDPIEEGDWDHISLFGVVTRDRLP